MWSPDDDDFIPEYYHQWAQTIAALPTEERARTLGAMPEDDRLIVQRLIDAAAIRAAAAERHSQAAGAAAPSARAGHPAQQPPKRDMEETKEERTGRHTAETERGAPPQRAHSAETLQHAASGSSSGSAAGGRKQRQPQRSSSYNLGSFQGAEGEDAAAAAAVEHASAEGAQSAAEPEIDLLGMSGDATRAQPVPQQQEAATQGAPAPAGGEGHDLLGMSGRAAGHSRAAPPTATSHMDFLDFEDGSPGQHAHPAQPEDEDILGMFSASKPSSSAAPAPQQAPAQTAAGSRGAASVSGLDELFGGGGGRHKAAGDSMIDFGGEEAAAAAAGIAVAGPGDVDVEGEPEVCPCGVR